MPESAVAEPAAVTEIANPVLQPSHLEQSKDIFKQEMAKAAVPPAEPVQAPEPDKAASTPEPDKATPSDTVEPKKDEAPAFPQELLEPKKGESAKVDDAIAQIDAMVLPKNAKSEQVASFSKLKEAAKKELQAKLDRITELESKSSVGASKAETDAAQARVEAAEAKTKELEAIVERQSFTESPKFKAFNAEETASLEGAKSYLAGTEISPDVIDLAARHAGSKRLSILKEAGIEGDVISAVSPYLAQFDAIQRSKAASLENWKAESAQYDQAQKAQAETAKAQRTAEEDRVWNTVVSKAETEILPLRKVEKNDDWNRQSDELKATAKKIYNGEGVGLDTVADTITKGVAYPVLNEMFQSVVTRLNAANAENAKLKAAKPDGGLTQGGAPIATDDSKLTADERAKKSFNEQMAAVGGTSR